MMWQDSSLFSLFSIGIAPLDRGSGLKIKVMTYLSAGLPVVGTKIAFQGYKPSQVLTETDLDMFAGMLLEQINSHDASIYSLAREEYLKNYLNAADIDHLVDAYRNLRYDAEANMSNSKVIYFDINNLPWLKEFRESPYPICTETTYIN